MCVLPHAGASGQEVQVKPLCWACFKPVAYFSAKRPGGKRRRAHKCPHRVACIAGTPEGSQGYNGPPLGGAHYCRPCVDAHKAYWRERENAAHARPPACAVCGDVGNEVCRRHADVTDCFGACPLCESERCGRRRFMAYAKGEKPLGCENDPTTRGAVTS